MGDESNPENTQEPTKAERIIGARPRELDYVAFLKRQRAFSERVFGPQQNPERLIRHMEKEITELRASPDDLMECIDIIILAQHYAMSRGYSPEAVAWALEKKQLTNEAREWPDWKEVGEDEPIEHRRRVP